MSLMLEGLTLLGQRYSVTFQGARALWPAKRVVHLPRPHGSQPAQYETHNPEPHLEQAQAGRALKAPPIGTGDGSEDNRETLTPAIRDGRERSEHCER
jgi:hypothetical protein